MDVKKVFILLTVLVICINYTNYFQQDSEKLYRTIENLKMKIAQEKEIQKRKIQKEELQVGADKLVFDGTKLSYSEAMGKLQDIITKSTQKSCTLTKIQWAQTPSTNLWYDRLRMNVSLQCTPKDLFSFINRLKENNKLFVINNLRVLRMRNKEKLYVKMQVMAYRKNR